MTSSGNDEGAMEADEYREKKKKKKKKLRCRARKN